MRPFSSNAKTKSPSNRPSFPGSNIGASPPRRVLRLLFIPVVAGDFVPSASASGVGVGSDDPVDDRDVDVDDDDGECVVLVAF